MSSDTSGSLLKNNVTARLFVGILYGLEKSYRAGLAKLQESFGPVFFESPERRWSSTRNHYRELGSSIRRKFVFFERLILQDEIAGIKCRTIEIEGELSEDGARTVNIDPGYLTFAKVVLATTKDYSHRIYLGKGIFAEVSLIFKDSTYQPNVFTYNDYREEESVRMFMEMRSALKEKMNSLAIRHSP